MDRQRPYLGELLSAAMVLAVAGALLYLLGDAFRSGFLAAFGVDKDVFPVSLEGVLLAGFESMLFLATAWSVPLLILVTAVVLLTGALAAIWHYRDRPRWKRVSRLFFYSSDDESRRDRERHVLTHGLLTWCFRLLVVGGAIMALLMLWTSAYTEGEELAADLRVRMDSGVAFTGIIGTWPYAFIRYQTSESAIVTVEGFIVESSPEIFAIYSDKRILLLPSGRIVDVRISGASKDARP